jgi:hypothetical protein
MLPYSSVLGGHMLDPRKALEREAMLKRIRELNVEIAQHERNLRDGEARLPIEEQLRLNLHRLIASLPELAGKIEVTLDPGPVNRVPAYVPPTRS